MQPRTKKEKTWANDVAIPPIPSTSVSTPKVTEDQEVVELAANEDSEALDDLEWLKRRTVAGNTIQGARDPLVVEADGNARPSAQVCA